MDLQKWIRSFVLSGVFLACWPASDGRADTAPSAGITWAQSQVDHVKSQSLPAACPNQFPYSQELSETCASIQGLLLIGMFRSAELNTDISEPSYVSILISVFKQMASIASDYDPCPFSSVIGYPENYRVSYYTAAYEYALIRSKIAAKPYAVRAFLCESLATENFIVIDNFSNFRPRSLDNFEFKRVFNDYYPLNLSFDVNKYLDQVLQPLLDKERNIVLEHQGNAPDQTIRRELSLARLYRISAARSDNLNLDSEFGDFLREYADWHYLKAERAKAAR